MSNPLAIRTKGTGSYDLVRFNQGLNAEVIATVAGTMPAITIGEIYVNRANQLGNRLCWLADNKAYQKTGTGGSVIEKLNTLGATDNRRTGWLKYYMHPTDGPGLFGATMDNIALLIKYDYLTDAWSTTSLGITGWQIASYLTRASVVLQGIGYLSHGARIGTLDPVAASLTWSASQTYEMELMGYNDILYVLKANASGSPYQLGQWVGGTFILLSNVTNSESPANDNNTKPVIYQIGGDTYVACNNESSSNDGWVAGKWDGTVYTEVTNTLLPEALRPGGDLATNNAREWAGISWRVQEGDTTRTFINFWFDEDATSSILYEHVGSTWVLRNSSQYGNQYSSIQNQEAGGDLYYDAAELNAIRISKEVTVGNGMELEYYVNGDAGSSDTFCALWYSVDGGGTWTRATIIAPSGGTGGSSSISANNLQNVDANGDTGSPTTYTIIHDWSADGLTSTDSVFWHLRCSKTAL